MLLSVLVLAHVSLYMRVCSSLWCCGIARAAVLQVVELWGPAGLLGRAVLSHTRPADLPDISEYMIGETLGCVPPSLLTSERMVRLADDKGVGVGALFIALGMQRAVVLGRGALQLRPPHRMPLVNPVKADTGVQTDAEALTLSLPTALSGKSPLPFMFSRNCVFLRCVSTPLRAASTLSR